MIERLYRLGFLLAFFVGIALGVVLFILCVIGVLLGFAQLVKTLGEVLA